MPESIPANIPIFVAFTRREDVSKLASINRPFVAVYPDYSDWNNFTFYFSATLLVFLPDKEHPLAFDMNLMFADAKRTRQKMAELLGTESYVPVSDIPNNFCSILQEEDEYRRIVKILGFERAVSALRILGDAVVLQMEGVDKERLALVGSEAFHLGALRKASNYTALRRGGRYLRPSPQSDTDDAAVNFQLVTSLPSADNFYELKLDFSPDELLRDRLAVIIGPNGTGKTQLMERLIRGLQFDSETDATVAPIVLHPRPQFNRVLMFSSVASDPYLTFIPPWKGIDYQYFSMVARSGQEIDSLTTALADCLRDDGRIKFVYRSDTSERTVGRLELLEESLASLGIFQSIHLPLVERDGPHDFPDTTTWGERAYFPLGSAGRLNEQRRLTLVQSLDRAQAPVIFGVNGPRKLSSGELAMLRFAAQAAGAAENGSLFLFDEPETHLHPKFVSGFVSILHRILLATKSIAIILTHSAYIVREVPRQRVRVFKLDGRNISIDSPRLQTYGASIDSISQFVFDDTEISHQYQTTLDEWLRSLGPDVTIEQIVRQFGHTMNSETLSYSAEWLHSRKQ